MNKLPRESAPAERSSAAAQYIICPATNICAKIVVAVPVVAVGDRRLVGNDPRRRAIRCVTSERGIPVGAQSRRLTSLAAHR
jgi:hypothetical protein